MPNYIDVISRFSSTAQASCSSDPTVYSNIVWAPGETPISQQALDEWAAANPTTSQYRHITGLAFRNRFTQAEKVGLELASLDNPSASMAQRQQAAALRASMKDSEQASYIDLDRADTRAGVIQLEQLGLLAAGRALQILDNPVQAHEIPMTNYLP